MDIFITGIVVNKVIIFVGGTVSVIGIENPDGVINAFLFKNLVNMYPYLFKQFRLVYYTRTAVTGPVGVHFVVKSEHERMLKIP